MLARIAISSVLVFSLAGATSAAGRRYEHRLVTGRVVSVEDGDSCTVLDRDGHRHQISLYGVDAPERGQPYWTHARDALSKRIYEKEVRFDPVEVDRDGRKLGHLYVGDRHINLDQVREGYGWHYTGHDRLHEFTDAERDAREHHRGLWVDKHPVEPWKYRHDHRDAYLEHERR